MPTFDTPEPISVVIDLVFGRARIIASERSDTNVDVCPSNRFKSADVATAELTRVRFSNGRLSVTVPAAIGPFGVGGAVLVTIELPAGSRLHGEAVAADFHCTGRLGECRLATDRGHLRLDRAGALQLTVVAGDVTVEHAAGDVEVDVGCGDVRIGAIEGTATVTRTSGRTGIGEVSGALRVLADNGDIHIGRAHAAVEARTGFGNIRVEEVTRGSIALDTTFGDLEVGVAEGAATRSDVTSTPGRVDQALDILAGPRIGSRTARPDR